MIIGFGYGFGLCLTARRAGIELLTCVFAGCGFCYFSAIPCMCCILCIAAYTRMLMLLVIMLCPFAIAVFFELFYFLCLCIAADGTSVCLCSLFCMRGCFGYLSAIPCVRRCLDISAYLTGVLMIFCRILFP